MIDTRGPVRSGRALWALGAALGSVLVGGSQNLPAQAQSSEAGKRCAALAGLARGGVEITSARLVPAAAAGTVRINSFSQNTFPVALPEYCRVEGVINRRKGADGVEYGIAFAVALPGNWEGRLVFQGGGGFNGTLREPYGQSSNPQDPALAKGFAVVSTDSGHKGATFDTAFMRDQQASIDFAFNSVPTVTLLAKELAEAYFGRPPHHTYSAGCSTGGREGMIAAQRFPALFDGVISGAPAMRTAHSRIAGYSATIAFNKIAPRDAEGKPLRLEAFPAEDQKLLHAAVAKQCDALDGLADGMIFNLGACRFDPKILQCKAGKSPGCLSAAQVGALNTAFGGPRDNRGEAVYASFPYDLGLLGEHVGSRDMSLLPQKASSPFDTPPSPYTQDVDAETLRARTNPLQMLSDTDHWADLGSFYRKGGKIIFYNGASDPWFSIRDTEDYFRRNKAANPEFDSSRLYGIPNMGHCGGGTIELFDMLTPLVEWVERGVAPGAIFARSWTGKGPTRPLCPWPSYAHYRGSGDTGDAASFECRGG